MKITIKKFIVAFIAILLHQTSIAQNAANYIASNNTSEASSWLILVCLPLFILFLVVFGVSYFKFKKTVLQNEVIKDFNAEKLLQNLNSTQIETYLRLKNANANLSNNKNSDVLPSKSQNFAVLLGLLLVSNTVFAQNTNVAEKSLFNQPGIIITIILLLIPIMLGAVFIIYRITTSLKKVGNSEKLVKAKELAEEIKLANNETLEKELIHRKEALNYKLNDTELSGTLVADDIKGIIQNVSNEHQVHFTAVKKKAVPRPILEPNISKLIIWYLGCSAFWLVIGSGIGEYVGIKFVMPDIDHQSWLSFGRLRPTHTNMVFWGWASIGILGLGHYVVPTVSNTKLYSVKLGWISLLLINIQVVLGTISLMMGVNNGGGEFREYIWPIMAFFAVALIITLANFVLTVANRTTKEIYISNWYLVSALIFTIIVALTAYLPFWQHGLGETITQGYYMHSGVGMWFTLFTLGLLYYFIPQQLNKPIYAYSLGILAFWTQILFYTIIGTHHFVFSSIAWWLQTVAIVGSAGMVIPVVAGTINFVMTFKGHMNKVASSYTLPFFFTAVVYYFVVSMQGTAEAFRYTNLIWHFTDFTVGHSHLGFYGIITFAIWGGTYAIVPRLTGKEPPQEWVGAHFWLAFIGLLLYSIPLMIGGTLKGLMWLEGKPFIDSVVLMFEYWIWRAIGGSLMFVSHLIYFYNFYKMTFNKLEDIDVQKEAFNILENEFNSVKK